MTSDPPEWAYAAALASLPLQTHRRLRLLITRGSPSDVWGKILHHKIVAPSLEPHVLQAWSTASSCLPRQMYERCMTIEAQVVSLHDAAYPSVLRADPDAPAVLFVRGNLDALEQRRVAIIGTRKATQAGRHFAASLGQQLSTLGVAVVSGLARGIDVHAHRGVERASNDGATGKAIAVVASGLDVVYPREHVQLWTWVASHGALISESPPGTSPEAFRFPLRNRILAGISEVVVVVESTEAGGSMITVREAEKRGVTVLAVPGSPTLHTSQGTNALLRDGCAPVTHVDDVLVALGLDTSHQHGFVDQRETPMGLCADVLGQLVGEPRTIDWLAICLGESVFAVAVALGRLEQSGWVTQTSGWWEALVAYSPS